MEIIREELDIDRLWKRDTLLSKIKFKRPVIFTTSLIYPEKVNKFQIMEQQTGDLIQIMMDEIKIAKSYRRHLKNLARKVK